MRLCFKKKKLKVLTVQPLIIAIGPNIYQLHEFYVYFNNTIFKFNNFLKSLDCYFKIFHCLNLKYPLEGELVWLFIQKFFYDIITPCDKQTSALCTVINEILLL